jgi:hypothetical protein
MMTFSDLASVRCDPLAPFTDQLCLAVAAYLARFKGSSREHTESDLRCYLAWCAERGLDPLAAQRQHPELYIRPMQETRRFKPPPSPGVSRSRPGSTAPACWTASWSTHPAEHVRRPAVPPESPAPGFTHLQFEALPPPPASSNLTLANLTLADLTGADLTGADLTEAAGVGADLTGVTLTGEQQSAINAN